MGPTLPDPLEAPTLSRGAPLTMRLAREDEAAGPRAAGSPISSMAPAAIAAPPSGARPRRLRLAAAAGLAALTLVLSGVSLFRVLSAGSPELVIPPDTVTVTEPPPFAAPASGGETAPRDDPPPAPTAEASAPRPSSPEPVGRPAPKAARQPLRSDGGKPTGAPVWLKKAIVPAR